MEELIPIFLFMSVAAVLILRPISKKLGVLLEAMSRERLPSAAPHAHDESELVRIRMLLEHVAKRVDLMEERLDFTERLLGATRSNRAGVPSRMEGLHTDSQPEYLHG